LVVVRQRIRKNDVVVKREIAGLFMELIRFTGDSLHCIVSGTVAVSYQAKSGPLRPPTLKGTLEDRRAVKSGDYELREIGPDRLVFFRSKMEQQPRQDHFEVVIGRSGSELPQGANLILVEHGFFDHESQELTIGTPLSVRYDQTDFLKTTMSI
jgi:hypothetical protein